MAYTDNDRMEIRKRIAQACHEQIRRGGLASVKARTLAASLEQATGWIYRFYPDFDAVILAANSLTLSMLDERLSATAEESRGSSVADRFFALALTYMDFSQEEYSLWAALFEHQMPRGRAISNEHKQEHYILFRHIEEPLSEILPHLSPDELRMTARTIYSAVHGVVSIGLQPRLDPVPLPAMKVQLRMLTNAFARGYEIQTSVAATT
jgi:hypothetical protein